MASGTRSSLQRTVNLAWTTIEVQEKVSDPRSTPWSRCRLVKPYKL